MLLGVTGSGKTFTMAQIIARVNRPTLVMAHNKTLAAQLYQEFRRFFPHNAVEYFVSYYDYYQPEAYIPATDSYIEKDATINDEIDRMRLAATRSLFERRDVHHRRQRVVHLRPRLARGLLRHDAAARARAADRPRRRSCASWSTSSTSATTSTSTAAPSACAATSSRSSRRTRRSALRIELFGDEVDELASFDPLTGKVDQAARQDLPIYPEVALRHAARRARCSAVESDQGGAARAHRAMLEQEGKLLEAQRLQQRTMFDLEMMQEIGYCHGIENYSRHLSGRSAGEPPPTLLDYFRTTR